MQLLAWSKETLCEDQVASFQPESFQIIDAIYFQMRKFKTNSRMDKGDAEMEKREEQTAKKRR